jgi:hypothetical protein
MGCPPIRVRCRVRWSVSEKVNGSGAGMVSSDDPWCAVISHQCPFHLLTTKKIKGVSSDIWMAINYFIRLPNVCSKIFSNCKIYKLVDWHSLFLGERGNIFLTFRRNGANTGSGGSGKARRRTGRGIIQGQLEWGRGGSLFGKFGIAVHSLKAHLSALPACRHCLSIDCFS